MQSNSGDRQRKRERERVTEAGRQAGRQTVPDANKQMPIGEVILLIQAVYRTSTATVLTESFRCVVVICRHSSDEIVKVGSHTDRRTRALMRADTRHSCIMLICSVIYRRPDTARQHRSLSISSDILPVDCCVERRPLTFRYCPIGPARFCVSAVRRNLTPTNR